MSTPPRATLGEKGWEVVDKGLSILSPWRDNSEVGLTVSSVACSGDHSLIHHLLAFLLFPHFLISPLPHCAFWITTQINSCAQILVSGSGFHGMQTKAPYYLADPLLDKYPRKMLACLHQEIFITV